ncbi:MAG: hypothetical protein ACRD52_00710 [Candidatus Acidiferrales bacterium]
MSASGNAGWFPKISPAGVVPGPGAVVSAETSVVCGVNTNVLIAQGAGYVVCDAHTSYAISTDGGTTFVALAAASATAPYWSDGVNFYARGDATGGTINFFTIG